MKQYEVKPHLSEVELGKFLEAVLEPEHELVSQYTIKVGNKSYRVDYSFVLDGVRYLVEFDGTRHFTEMKTIVRDKNLKDYCIKNELQLVTIPYFIQLTDTSVEMLFGSHFYDKIIRDKVDVITNFKSGFIDSKCVMPWDFNITGMELFFNKYLKFGFIIEPMNPVVKKYDHVSCDCSTLIKEIWESVNKYSHTQEYKMFIKTCEQFKFNLTVEKLNHYPT